LVSALIPPDGEDGRPSTSDGPVTVSGAWHTGFQVSDLDASLAFYCGLLGFAVIWRRTVNVDYIRRLLGYPGLELHQALLRIPGSQHCLELLDYRNVARSPVDTQTANPGTAHLCLTVEGLPAIYERLTRAGVEFISEPVRPTEGPNVGGLVVYMADPDGIRIELVDAKPT
jgi:lactoylglutathione lyase